MQFKKRDAIIAAIIGEVVALYFILFLGQVGEKMGIPMLALWSLVVVFPILSVVCLWVSFLIGRLFLFIYQLAKFILVGALATIFDLGSLGLFIDILGISSGWGFTILKGISFIIATIGKYFADKIWAFEKKDTKEAGMEFGKFFLVTLVGFVINVSVASYLANGVGPQFGLSSNTWAQVSAMGAIVLTFAWNFVGYKFIVFKK